MPARLSLPNQRGPLAYEALPCPRCPGKDMNLCRPLDRQLQTEFFQIATRQRWTRHELLFRGGDEIGSVFKVTAGIVAVSKMLQGGQRQILRFALPGDVCGYLSEGNCYSFDGEAITGEVITCSFDRSRFEAFVARHPTAARPFGLSSRPCLSRSVCTLRQSESWPRRRALPTSCVSCTRRSRCGENRPYQSTCR
jgi:CRP-like cAMP-binding protein